MRWEQLFADLDSQFAQLAGEDVMAQLPDRQRHAAGSVSMVQRCLGAIGVDVRVRLRGGAVHDGVLRDVGPDWLLLAARDSVDTLISAAAVTAIEGLTRSTGVSLPVVAGRFDLRLALRGIARDRAPVAVAVMDARGGQHGDVMLAGTIDRVGADFIEVAQHATWEPRRASAVRSVVLIPLAGLDSVRAIPAL